MKYFISLLCMVSIGLIYAQDSITLKNGSIIIGEITKVQPEEITLKTNFSNDVKIKVEEIKSFESKAEYELVLENEKRYIGKLKVEDGRFTMDSEGKDISMKHQDYVIAFPKGNDPRTKPRWKYNAAFDLVGKTGNTEEMNLAINLQATLKRIDDQISAYAKHYQSEVNGEQESDEYIVGADYERKISDRFNWYIRGELEQDEFEDIKLRQTYATGLGYYVYDDDKKILRLRGGLLYRHEDYYDQVGTEETVGLDTGLHWEYKFTWSKWVTDITYEPSIDDKDDFIVKHESSLDIPFNKYASIRTGISHDYDNMPASGLDRTDTKYFVRLVFTWD